MKSPRDTPRSAAADRVAALSRQQLGALVQRLRAPGEERIPRLPGRGPFALSFAQERLWLAEQLVAGNAAYNVPARLHCRGRLHVARLACALAALVARHASLRTRYPELDGVPAQEILVPAAPAAWRLPVLDLHGLRSGDRSAEAERLARREASRPFDLERGPVLRARLLRLETTGGRGREQAKHELLLTLHHIAADGWSLGLLLRQLAAEYGEVGEEKVGVEDDGAGEKPAAVRYVDFAAWQRQRLRGERLQRLVEQARRRLAGAHPAVPPADHSAASEPGSRRCGGRVPVCLPLALSEAARALRERGGGAGVSNGGRVTLFMVLCAAFQALLARVGGEADLTLGTPVAQRGRRELEEVVGFFVNTLVLRTDLRGDPTFAEALSRTRETLLGAEAERELPFEKLALELQQGELTPARENPLFRTLFVFDPAPLPSFELPGLTLTPSDVESGSAKFELSFFLSVEASGLRGNFEFDRGCYDATTIRRLAGHFEHLLAAAAAAPQTRLSALPLLSSAERHQLGMAWAEPLLAARATPLVHELVQQTAARLPERIALSHGRRFLSYRELVRQAHHLADRLTAQLDTLAAGPEPRVGLAVCRSPRLVIALLAVLESGAAYLPLDPEYPAERLGFMLEDGGVSLLLTDGCLLTTGLPRLPVLRLDEAPAMPAPTRSAPAPRRVPALDGQRLAYLIYTSGSTGRPKGVMVHHAGVANMIHSYIRSYAIGPHDRMLQQASISFDVSVADIFPILGVGGTLVLPEVDLFDFEALVPFVTARALTVISATPSMLGRLNQLVAAQGGRQLGQVSLILSGGEALSYADADRLVGSTTVINGYGPTEITVCCLTYDLARYDPRQQASIPIGRPVRGAAVHVVDARLRQLPIGCPGELVIAGSGVARGYHQRPRLTAERFVPNPFHLYAGARLYRSGDLARWRADGEVEFLGRIDTQVKLRGLRIELGEIETALLAQPAVEAVVVVVREERLVAYVVGQSTKSAGERLRAALAERLPAFMVPDVFVPLDVLPLTPNRKIDRERLPAPQDVAAARRVPYVAPRNQLERQLVAAWAEVLALEPARIGVEDTFFELGGHSLNATQVVSRIRRLAGVEVALRSFFEMPTVAALAARLRAPDAADASAEPISRRQGSGEAPLSFAQERLWFLDQLEPAQAVYNMAALVRLQGTLAVASLQRAFTCIAQRQAVLRTSLVVRGDSPTQVVAPADSVHLPVVDLSRLVLHVRVLEQQRLSTREARRPFTLAQGPLWRLCLIRQQLDDHAALLTLHHSVADGWSMGVMLRELAQFYGTQIDSTQFNRVEDSVAPGPVAPLPIQYSDFAAWQRQQWTAGAWDGQLDSWRQRLAGLPELLPLPTDRPRPAIESHRGATLSWHLPAHCVEALQVLQRSTGTTLFMVLLAAFQTLLYRLSGSAEVLVGSPIANRNRAEVEGLIGLFVNSLVLRGRLGDDPTFTDLLGRVRTVALEAYDHQDLPFEQLVAELRPERRLDHGPLFQVMLVLQNEFTAPAQLPGLKVTPSEVPTGTSKLDLTLALQAQHDGGHGALLGTLEYATDLFDATTAQRWLGHLRQLLEAAAAGPQLRLSALPLLDAAAQHQLRIEHNVAVELRVPKAVSAVELIQVQARRTPEAVALVDALRHVSYGELLRRASVFAGNLPIVPGTPVVVEMARTSALVERILGVLLAGGTYVPVDPAYPAERKAFLRRDAQTGPAAASCHLIYTSGSTGTPKGVAVPHSAVVHLLRWARSAHTDAELAGTLAATSVCFDLSVFEIFAPLAWGGAVILADDALHLPRHPHRHRVTLLNTVPSAAAELIQQALPPSVRTINLAGEPLRRALVDDLYAQPGVERVQNLYGPSEDTTYSTSVEVPIEAPKEAAEPTIGRPLPGTTAHIVDRHLNLVPLGVPGELWLGGPGLAQGYHRRPAQTAQAFVPNPFCCESPLPGPAKGPRLYRTGDLVRRRGDGELDFLGRRDHQVKVRGYRIELGEIEATLQALTQVEAAAVVAREDRLVAFVVLRSVEGASLDPLQAALAACLPAFMLPVLMRLAALPLTPNGKVDRRALLGRALTPAAPASGATSAASEIRPEIELIAGIWRELLQVDALPADAHFFQLGGHSLLATRLVSRLRDVFEVELELRQLFETPTLEAQATLVQAVRRQTVALQTETWQTETGSVSPLSTLPLTTLPLTTLPLTTLPRPGAPPWELGPPSFAQERLWFLDRLMPDNPFYNMSAALRLTGELDVLALRAALDALVQRHEALRTRFATRDGEPVQVVMAPVALPWGELDLRRLAPQTRQREARRRLVAAGHHSFDLTRGPLCRLLLLRLGQDQRVLLIALHHIVADGWSLRVAVRELIELYRRAITGEAEPLPPLPVQYADFAAWQRRYLDGQRRQQQLDYWRRQLADLPVLELPTDRPRPRLQSFRGARVSLAVPQRTASALRQLARSRDVTFFMLLLTAFEVVLARLCGATDLAVASPIANRTRSEIEGLIGFFVNTLVLRLDAAAGEPGESAPSFDDLLQRVRTTTLAAYDRQDLPFETLVAELSPCRDLSRNPLVQVSFQQLRSALDDFVLEGLHVTPYELAGQTARFDLEVTAETGQQALQLHADYASDLFDATTVQRWLQHLLVLLTAVAAAVDASPKSPVLSVQRPIWQLALLDRAQRHQVLQEWRRSDAPTATRSGTEPWRSGAVSVLQQIFEQARRTPHRVAVVAGEEAVDYATLVHHSWQLAAHLRRRGVGPEVAVAVCVERSVQTLVSLLAVWSAGGVYVPLEPASPVRRLAFQLEDCAAALVLVDAASESRLRELPSAQDSLLAVPPIEVVGPAPPPGNPVPAPHVEQAAYILYTSGSSGRPKGVVIPHGELAEHVRGVCRWQGLGADDRVLQFASFGFDVSLEQLLPALTCGARVVLRGPELWSPVQCLQQLAHHGVTVANLPTAYWRQLARDWPHREGPHRDWPHREGPHREGQPVSAPPSVRLWIAGGEAMTAEALDAWRQTQAAGGAAQLLNAYGPTEATITASIASISAARDRPSTACISLGRPLPGRQFHVFDRHGQPLPIGAAGELCLGGSGLARGYHGRPARTAAAFRPHPAAAGEALPGSRLYHSGDRVRHLADGRLAFAGRTDTQLKVRGVRIEAGEIERTLERHPEVAEAAAVVPVGAEASTAFARPRPRVAGEPMPTQGQDRVGQWREVFDDTYTRGGAEAAARGGTFLGWDSSYTGAAIPEAEMREWTETTLARLRTLAPPSPRILEIGCGTGLLLSRLAADSRRYVGCDFSAAALAAVEGWLQEQPEALRQRVELWRREAHDLETVAAASFDLVVINSVVQYFPSADYLQRVLEQVVRVTAPGGRVLLGDVRSLPLLETFHLSVELARASSSQPIGAWRQRLHQRFWQEEELVVDPRLLRELPLSHPELAARLDGISILLRRGRAHNELSRFRYDAVLYVGDDVPALRPPAPPAPPARAWTPDLDLPRLRCLLATADPLGLRVTGIPNARLAVEARAWQLLATADDDATVGGLRDAALAAAGEGLDPEVVWRLQEEEDFPVGRRLELSWSSASGGEARAGAFDLWFSARGQAVGESLVEGPLQTDPLFTVGTGVEGPPASSAPARTNDPLQGRWLRALPPRLLDFLRRELPAPAVPSTIVLLPELPRTPSGKIDRPALRSRASAQQQEARRAVHQAPRDRLETRLLLLWEEVLERRPLGVRDGFFDLGGHSLLAVRLVARVEQELGARLPVSAVFEHGTVEAMASLLRRRSQQGDGQLADAPAAESRSSAAHAPNLLRLAAGGDRPPLVCVHPSGGTVFCYLPLARQLQRATDGVAVYALEATLREGGAVAAGAEGLEDLATVYLDQLRTELPSGPLHLLGWSFGGMLAFELACRLPAATLTLVDTAPPRSQPRERDAGPPEDAEPMELGAFAQQLGLISDDPAADLVELQRQAPGEPRLRWLLERSRRQTTAAGGEGGLPPDVGVPQLRRLFETFAAHLRALEAYRPRHSFDGPTLLVRASDSGISAPVWRRWAPRLEEAVLPGDHFSLLRLPTVRELATAWQHLAGSDCASAHDFDSNVGSQ